MEVKNTYKTLFLENNNQKLNKIETIYYNITNIKLV